jgi:glycosyltransferase involved in cell wall biosynthesis
MPQTFDLFDFSVLIPVYSKENPQFLQQALDSCVNNQSLLPSEIIVVEDGPITEELDRVLSDFRSGNQQLRRLSLKQNLGVGGAMRFGLANVNTPWVARMDSDDLCTDDRFKKQIDFLKNNPLVDVLGGAIEEFHHLPGDIRLRRKLPSDHNDIVSFMKRRNPINHMTVIFKKDLAIRCGSYSSEPNVEDYRLWYEMYKQGARFHNLDQVLVNVRIGNNMIARRTGFKYFRFERELIRKFYRDGFINSGQYVLLYCSKLILRIIPMRFLKIFYQTFLREKAS